MDKTTGVDYGKKEKNPAEIRSEIEETRAQLGDTVEEIKERFSSEHVKSQVRDATIGRAKGAMQQTARKARDLSTSAVETVKRDPLPYLTIGAGFGIGIGGLLWLMRRHGNGYSEEGYRYSTREFEYPAESHPPYETSEQEPGAMKDLARKTQEKARKAREQADMAMARAKEKTAELGERALERSRELKSHVGESVERNPFVLGSLFFALGSAIGFLVPSMAGPIVDKVGTMGGGTERKTMGTGEEEIIEEETIEESTTETTATHSELETGETGSTYPGQETGRTGGGTDRKFPEEV